MYAAVVIVTIDPAHQDEAQASLETAVVPMVKAAPGFIAGYWCVPAADGRAPAMVVFETEEQARQAAPPLGPAPFPGVTVDSVEFLEIAASA